MYVMTQDESLLFFKSRNQGGTADKDYSSLVDIKLRGIFLFPETVDNKEKET